MKIFSFSSFLYPSSVGIKVSNNGGYSVVARANSYYYETCNSTHDSNSTCWFVNVGRNTGEFTEWWFWAFNSINSSSTLILNVTDIGKYDKMNSCDCEKINILNVNNLEATLLTNGSTVHFDIQANEFKAFALVDIVDIGSVKIFKSGGSYKIWSKSSSIPDTHLPDDGNSDTYYTASTSDSTTWWFIVYSTTSLSSQSL